MNVKHGTCALCLTKGPLQSSHLLPKALYRFVSRLETLEAPNPVIVTRNSVWQSSKQVEAHLLCSECEQRFHKYGEDWTLRHCYRGKGRFRLQEILATSAPIEDTGETLVFAAHSIPEIDVKKLAYFAASVFWRASIHRWNVQDHRLRDIDLGKKYTDEFRQFLLGMTGFPNDAAILIDIFGFRSPAALATMLFPYGEKQENFHYYRFTIPGVAFNLYVGQLVPSTLRDCSILRSSTGVLFSSKEDTGTVEDFTRLMRTAKVSLGLKQPN
jgi:hypothetical protein